MGGHFIPTHHAEVNRSLAQGTSVKLSKLHVGRFNYNNITPVFMILPFWRNKNNPKPKPCPFGVQ